MEREKAFLLNKTYRNSEVAIIIGVRIIKPEKDLMHVFPEKICFATKYYDDEIVYVPIEEKEKYCIYPKRKVKKCDMRWRNGHIYRCKTTWIVEEKHEFNE